MSRRLFAVALLPPEPLRTQIDGLRIALDDPRRHDLPSHLTLVPPIALAEDRTEELRTALRAVARSAAPFELELGPAATFSPRTSTLHLSVGGEQAPLDALRDALRTAPLDRPDEHDFVPHVTLLQRATDSQVDAGVQLLGSRLGPWQVTSLHLLERLRPESGAVWHPVVEEPLGGPRVVGRGGVELHLRSTSVVEQTVADLADLADLAGLTWTAPLPAGGDTLVTIAELPGATGVAVGAAWGRAATTGAVLDQVLIDLEHRGHGIARQVVGEWCHAAAARGSGVVAARPSVADPGDPADAPTFLSTMGFGRIDATTWCRRVGPVGEVGSPA